MLITKILGIILIIIGGWLVVRFPASADYQTNEIKKAGITIGMALLLFGILLFLV